MNPYQKKALAHLSRDVRMKKVIRRSPVPSLGGREDAFFSLARAIVYQQLSGKAAGTIFGRFLELFPKKKLSPKALLRLPEARLRGAGVSGQKISYLRDLAAKFLDGTVSPPRFHTMEDEDIRTHLIAVKGVGRWTADMFLIFTLGRPDVFPTGDLGIRNGFKMFFGLQRHPSVEKMERLAEAWRPYRSFASWYLWRVADEQKEKRERGEERKKKGKSEKKFSVKKNKARG